MPDETPAAESVTTPEATPAPAPSTQSPPASTGGDPMAELRALDTEGDGEGAPAPEPEPQVKPPVAAKVTTPTAAAAPVGRPPSREPKLAAIKDPVTRDLLKRMDNAAFNKFYDLAVKLQAGELIAKEDFEKQLKSKELEWEERAKASRFLDHEEGYTLTPEYKETAGRLQAVQNEADFWAEQLANFRAGQPVEWLYQNEKGEVVKMPSQLDPKDPSLEGRILSKITKAAAFTTELERELNALPSKHKTEYGRVNGVITNMDKLLFDGLEKADPSFGEEAAKEIAAVPAGLRSRPEFKLLGKALAAGKRLLTMNEQLKQQLAKQTTAASTAGQGAPDPSTIEHADADELSDEAAFRQLDAIAARR